jgi:short-subunit dehydrogenase
MTAFLPFPGLVSYAAAKHALRALHHGLALEERGGPLNFTIIHPTSTETPMLEQEAASDEVPLAFASTPVSAEFVAEVVLRATDRKTLEVFMPPERARYVRLAGTNPRTLRKTLDRGEEIGARRLEARRARTQPEES